LRTLILYLLYFVSFLYFPFSLCHSRCPMTTKPSLIVHGGAWDIPDEAVDACNSGCQSALAAGWSILSGGGSALAAVEAAIVVLEDDPVFDAGYGSHLNLDGRVECDAIVMDGATLRAGSVAALHHVRNPIRLARRVLEHCPHMMLVGEGAERFAASNSVPLCDPQVLIAESEWQAWQLCKKDQHAAAHHRGHEQGTVGAVAIDSLGALFAATSTGGTCCKLPGRVGDSPLIGCGCYADSEAGGVSATGYGEAIMKIVMAKAAVDYLRVGFSVTADGRPNDRQPNFVSPSPPSVLRSVPHADNPSSVRDSESFASSTSSTSSSLAMRSAQAAVALLARKTRATGGLILLDRHGNPGFAFNTPRMAYAYVSPDGSFVTAV
jgi:beta-aspartyl-peptidase (threonine type)